MKRFKSLSVLLALMMALCLALAACDERSAVTENGSGGGSTTEQGGGSTTGQGSGGGTVTPSGDVLVAYFSASGNTGRIAQYIAEATGADTFEITPVEPYTSDDLNWTDNNSRVVKEHNDPTLQDIELVKEMPDGWDDYKTVFVGYPIWWGIAAWPVNGFVEINDFTGKTVIPFCTSSSSPLGESGTNLAEMAGTGDWKEGKRFSSSASKSDVEEWIALE